MADSKKRLAGNRTVGRPRLLQNQRKIRVSLSVSRDVLAYVDTIRGTTSRSQFIESLLDASAEQSGTSRDYSKRNGAVYTPPNLAHYLAKKVIDCLFADNHLPWTQNNNCSFPKILDPACGSGELLCAAWHQLLETSEGMDLPYTPLDVLYGIDNDSLAVRDTWERLQALAAMDGQVRRSRSKIVNANALLPFKGLGTRQGWERLKKQFGAEDGFDIVIANPPWGADISSYRDELSSEDFTLLKGQFDTSDLFIELALSIIRPGGYIAFLLPDSLFSQERAALRKFLVSRTRICFVGRLGEKIFEGINRACALIVCKTEQAPTDSLVNCLRLTPEYRRGILSESHTYADAERQLGHQVLQSRFRENPECAFDIDVTSEDEEMMGSLIRKAVSFGEYLTSSRGIELSKHGRVCQCDDCHKWFPLPTGTRSKCPHCKIKLANFDPQVVSITSEKNAPGYEPLITGESVSRYRIQQSLWIAPHYSGINYKCESVYQPPKLLIRKTGVGISAAIDYSQAYTNQVVYILRPREDCRSDCPPLELFLGVLNSRAMYYYLVKKYGETEWRSHPYVTQKQMLSLPFPDEKTLAKHPDVVRQIVEMLVPYTTTGKELPREVDACVERLVARLFGLKRKHYVMIYKTLDSVQDLLPIRTLRQVQLKHIFGR